MVIIFAHPSSPPPVAADLWQSVRIEWFGADGSQWELTTGDYGVALDHGVEGLHDPVIDKFYSESRGVPGIRRRGSRALARPVFWPMWVFGDGGADWQAN